MRGGTVKQFKDLLEEMKKVYSYKDEKTFLSTYDEQRLVPFAVTVITEDEQTGVEIRMHKRIEEKQL
jgi:hypothetical protein